uniref:5-hydroxytryptamine receptor 3A-like n=2 Tax=Gasterosteus aculeatus aculeatus TaxID=481459 RepID=A0AAQ4NNY8_GASAC
MMLAGFFFLFLVSGGSTSNISEQTALQDDQPNFNPDNDEGFNISTTDLLKPPELNGSTNQNSKYPELQQRNQNDTNTTLVKQQSQGVTNHNSNCSDRAVYNHLNLVKNNDNSKIRPSRSRSVTLVKLDVLLYAILDVNEKEQQFVSYIWVFSRWYDYDINWNPQNFCDIWKIYPPSDVLWTPDLTIEEMIEDNKVPKSPYLLLDYDGEVFLRSNMVVVSSCSMEVYKFPFDVQNCKLSFKSVVHSSQDLMLQNSADHKWNIAWSLERMTQSEWLFVNLSSSEEFVDSFGLQQTLLVYTITMKRRSALYIANFLLPIMFFLGLDLASFGISDSGGEKLGFKVTVLLAVTVMQLILNDILPASSDRIPLIAIYCIGVFGLMMLSLLETILMMYLLGKDAAAKENREDEEQRRNLKKRTSADESPSEQLSVAKEGDSSKPTVESIALENISDELRDVEKTLTRVLNGRKEGNKPGYWTKVAEKVNTVFIVFYVLGVIVFLIVLFLLWNKEDEV